MKFKRKVNQGTKTGRRIGFPTLTFEVGNFADYYDKGVYSAQMEVGGREYLGALYYGPKMDHDGEVLEVFVLDLDEDCYEKFVEFSVLTKLRDPMEFKDLDTLKKQIQEDVDNIV